MRGLDCTQREPWLTNVLYPKIFVLKFDRLENAEGHEPKFAKIVLSTFGKDGRTFQKAAKMYNVARLTDGEYHVISEKRTLAVVVAGGNVQQVKAVKHESKTKDNQTEERVVAASVISTSEGRNEDTSSADGNQEIVGNESGG